MLITRATLQLDGTFASAYTCPTGKKAKVDALIACNTHASYDFKLYVQVDLLGAGSNLRHWVNGARVSGSEWEPEGRKPFILEPKQTLLAGDIIKAKIAAINQPSWVSTSKDIDLYLSIVEFE